MENGKRGGKKEREEMKEKRQEEYEIRGTNKTGRGELEREGKEEEQVKVGGVQRERKIKEGKVRCS